MSYQTSLPPEWSGVTPPASSDLKEFLRRARERPRGLKALSAANEAPDFAGGLHGPNWRDSTGVHLYCDLRLQLNLAAPESDRNARRYLQVLQRYAEVAEECCTLSEMQILEIQGERLHAFMDARTLGANERDRLLVFAYAFSLSLRARVAPLAEDSWRGYAMALDHGRALLVDSSLHDDTNSLISLGPTANRPAKRLNNEVGDGRGVRDGVPSGHLAFPMAPSSTSRSPVERWENVPLEQPPPTELATAINERAVLMLSALDRRGLTMLSIDSPGMSMAVNARLAPTADVAGATCLAPKTIKGFAMRVDLANFTPQVQAAFESNDPREILKLVTRFNAILGFPLRFRERIGRDVQSVTQLPWAGDQANLIIEPLVEEGYESAQHHLPVKASNEWHKLAEEFEIEKRRMSELMGSVKWAVGWAGGDQSAGDAEGHGRVLTGHIRSFGVERLVASGWGWRRAKDAQEADSVRAGDTVVTAEDYRALDSVYQEGFQPLGTLFYRAPQAALQQGERNRQRGLSRPEAQPYTAPNILVPVPAPRPYAIE